MIENFIDKYLDGIENHEDIDEEFMNYWTAEKEKELKQFCEDENIQEEKMQEIIDTFLHDQKKPLADDIYKTLRTKLKLKERKQVIPRS